MKHLLTCFTIVLFASIISFAQNRATTNRAIGIRLGDPMGITYKKYLTADRAIEFGLGSVSPGWHQLYYENAFEKIKKYDQYTYRSHTVLSTVYLQARYLINNNILIQGMEGKLNWYYGGGMILKVAKVKYYFDDLQPPFARSDTHSDIDFGPEGILGMEYTFQNIPMNVFVDFSLMLELADRLAVRNFSGLGARYKF
jgi:hypothetical protein